jgi:hypothetical protein
MDSIAGNMLTDDPDRIVAKLLDQHLDNDCSDCWTSCRGNFETLMYGSNRLSNVIDGYRMIKSVPLSRISFP